MLPVSGSESPIPTGATASSAAKPRPGRRPRPSLLSEHLKDSVAAFVATVGGPSIIEPQGFRNFTGWLRHLQSASVASAWGALRTDILVDCSDCPQRIRRIQNDIVREIIKTVVKRRPGESSKLVSTNARRQCARPASGVTLMTILDRVLDLPPEPTPAVGSTSASTGLAPREESCSYSSGSDEDKAECAPKWEGTPHFARALPAPVQPPAPVSAALPSIQHLLHPTGSSASVDRLPSISELFDDDVYRRLSDSTTRKYHSS